MTDMRVGLTTDPASLPQALTEFPDLAMCRVFGTVGKGLPNWNGQAIAALLAAHKIPWVSFKDWASDATALAAVNSWLDAMPATCTELWLTYHHEPEGDIAPATYRAQWQKFAATVRAHRFHDRIKLIPIHTLYPARHKIGDRFSTDSSKWVGTWQWWAPTDSRGDYLGDYMGWDCYLETNSTTYEAPERFFRAPIGAAIHAGVPLVLPELGALRTPTDTAGQGRAQWITDSLAYLKAHGCQAVNWWHATGSAGQDYRLSDVPSATAWRMATNGLS